MKQLSLEPDEHMRWIYDPAHVDYHSEQAEDLRARHAQALCAAPKWMVEEARLNDLTSPASRSPVLVSSPPDQN